MSRHILMQYSRGADYDELIDISRPWHRAYCESHGWQYLHQFMQVDVGKYDSQGCAFFALVATMRYIEDDAVIALIGADGLIVKPTVDLREAMGRADIAVHGNKTYANEGGLTIVRNKPETRTLFERICALGPIDCAKTAISYRVHEELMACKTLKIARLDDRWDWYDVYGESPNPTLTHPECDAIIRAWHGKPLSQRKRLMQETLKKISVRAA